MRSITAVPCSCPECGWKGVTGDAEPDVDGEGSLGCPECYKPTKEGRLVRPLVDIEYTDSERSTVTSGDQQP
jgi:hypothetical protein